MSTRRLFLCSTFPRLRLEAVGGDGPAERAVDGFDHLDLLFGLGVVRLVAERAAEVAEGVAVEARVLRAVVEVAAGHPRGGGGLLVGGGGARAPGLRLGLLDL